MTAGWDGRLPALGHATTGPSARPVRLTEIGRMRNIRGAPRAAPSPALPAQGDPIPADGTVQRTKISRTVARGHRKLAVLRAPATRRDGAARGLRSAFPSRSSSDLPRAATHALAQWRFLWLHALQLPQEPAGAGWPGQLRGW